ncbi:MAG: ArsA family ATPase [Lapillicoccus sp.]
MAVDGPRVVLFTGKGGVGKTTTAAACAVRAARSSVRTLVMSTDAAHSLGDALGHDLHNASTDPGSPVAVEAGLHALQVSATHTLDRSWRVVQDYLLQVLATLGIDPVVAEELTSLPGAEEVAALLELRHRVESGDWDLVVVDCAPTAETLRLLALPEALAWHLERLLPGQRGLLRTLRPAAAAAAGMPLPSAEVAGAVAGWYRQMRAVQALLSGPTGSVRLVLTPERVVIAEARRTWTSLSLYGFVVDGVVVNRVIPPARGGRGDAWRRAWTIAQDAGLAEVGDSFAGMPVVQVPYLPGEPVGPDALDALADAVTPWGPAPADAADPFAVLTPVSQQGLRVRRQGDGYRLTLPLPFVAAARGTDTGSPCRCPSCRPTRSTSSAATPSCSWPSATTAASSASRRCSSGASCAGRGSWMGPSW